MRTTVPARTAAPRLCATLVPLAIALPSAAATLEVSVVDDHGRPIENVAVYATPADAAEPAGEATARRARAEAPRPEGYRRDFRASERRDGRAQSVRSDCYTATRHVSIANPH